MSNKIINKVDVMPMKPLSKKKTENLASVSPRYKIESLTSNRSAFKKEDIVGSKIFRGKLILKYSEIRDR